MTNDQRKSDSLVLPTKLPNKTNPVAEATEGRRLAKGNVGQQNMRRTQCRVSVPSALDRVRQAARKDRKVKFTALYHHLTVERLSAAFHALKRNAAPGVDGVTWEQYAVNLQENLQELHARLHRGAYRAKPSRRVNIPKADGRLRPLGIASLEDKVVQRAVVEVLNCIYEADFLGFSYGFRPGRSQHQALDALAVAIRRRKVNWVLDADIRGFFDAISREWMVKFIEHRIADRRIVRLIQKWLSAGVTVQGQWARCELGTPQGATISPLLANIYLHYVLDLWVQHWRKKQARGDVIITRWADDFIVGFQYYRDAKQFLCELRERLRKFALELHPDKTRVLAFGRYAARERKTRGQGKPETFNFLGFTHICSKTQAGEFLLMRQTACERTRRKLQEVKVELRRRRHLSITEQGEWLQSVIRGHFAYYAVPTNGQPLNRFRSGVIRHWRHALRRRSQHSRITWLRMQRLTERWIPSVTIMHPWPDTRFDVRTQGKSPVR
jgi:group II intron reverse transcriptase/maturase